MARRKKEKPREIPYDWSEIPVDDIPVLVEDYDLYGLQIYARWGANHKEFTRTMPRVSHMLTGYSKPQRRRRYVQIRG